MKSNFHVFLLLPRLTPYVANDKNNNNQNGNAESEEKRFEKFGYSRNEVWNWLYTDNEEDFEEGEIEQRVLLARNGVTRVSLMRPGYE